MCSSVPCATLSGLPVLFHCVTLYLYTPLQVHHCWRPSNISTHSIWFLCLWLERLLLVPFCENCFSVLDWLCALWIGKEFHKADFLSLWRLVTGLYLALQRVLLTLLSCLTSKAAWVYLWLKFQHYAWPSSILSIWLSLFQLECTWQSRALK